MDTGRGPQMTNAEYLSLQSRLLLVADLIRVMDLDGFLARIELAHLAGPFLEPTLYAKTQDYLKAVELLARAARAFKSEAVKVSWCPKPDPRYLQYLNAAQS
jgi:hypothetical protein